MQCSGNSIQENITLEFNIKSIEEQIKYPGGKRQDILFYKFNTFNIREIGDLS